MRCYKFLIILASIVVVGCNDKNTVVTDQKIKNVTHKNYEAYLSDSKEADLPYEAFFAFQRLEHDPNRFLVEFSFPMNWSGKEIEIELNHLVITPTYGGMRLYRGGHYSEWKFYQSITGPSATGVIRLKGQAIPFTISKIDFTEDRRVFVNLFVGPDTNGDHQGKLQLYVGSRLFLGPPRKEYGRIYLPSDKAHDAN